MLVFQSFVFGLLIGFAAVYIRFLWSRRRLYYLAAKLPGPKGLPFIGMGHKFFNKNFKQIFDVLATITEGYKSPAAFWLGPELIVYAETPESLQIVLNSPKCLDKSNLYRTFALKKGLVCSGGETWRQHRKILNPSFSLRAMQQLVPTFDEKSRILTKQIEVKLDKKQFDVYGYLSACSLETLLKGTMNLDLDIQSIALENDYVHSTEISTQVMMKKLVNVIYQIEPLYRLTSLYHLEQKHYHQNMFRIADEVLDEQRNLPSEPICDQSEAKFEKRSRRPKSYIETLIDSNNSLSQEEIRDEINTLVAAGHETSALVLSNCLLMLATHPEVQQKVVKELQEVFGTADSPVEYSLLGKLVYLDMVLKETMRLFPVLPVSGRKSSEEFKIGDYTIPAGATIVISSFKVQRNKKYWGEDADQFRPERFEPESFKKVHPYAFIPFTGGPRICIGWRYGMMFMKTVLANLLRHYEVNTPLKYEDLEFEIIITMKVVQRCMITIKKRDFELHEN